MSKRILIIEDVDDNRELLVQFLENEYEIFEAKDGQQGLNMAEKIQPDLILLDLSLPILNGWQVSEALKGDERMRHIPIIAITAHAMVGDEERALSAGCDMYITKPVDFDDLQKMIKRTLERNHGSQ